VALMVGAGGAVGQPTVRFELADLVSGAVTNRQVLVVPASSRVVWSNKVVALDVFKTNTGSTGVFYLTNMIPAWYTLELKGPPGVTRWPFEVTNAAAGTVVEVADLVPAETANVNGQAYSRAQSDVRYWSKAGFVAGTNTTFRTNGTVVFIDTESGPADGGSVTELAAGANIIIETNRVGTTNLFTVTGSGELNAEVATYVTSDPLTNRVELAKVVGLATALANTTNHTAALSLNNTNHTELRAGQNTNHAAALSLNNTNFALTIGAGATNQANLVGANTTNHANALNRFNCSPIVMP
jgi:hypothetical protein